MRYYYAISALRDKRARIAGAIEQAERRLAKDRYDLATIDATLRLFHPEADPSHITSIRPVWRGIWFRHGEQRRLCLEALRDAGQPIPTRRVTEYTMRAKGLDQGDAKVTTTLNDQTREALTRLSRRELVRRVVEEPEVWWELVG